MKSGRMSMKNMKTPDKFVYVVLNDKKNTTITVAGLEELIKVIDNLYYHKRRRVVGIEMQVGETVIAVLETKGFKKLGTKE